VIAKLGKKEGICLNLINNAMFLIDAPRPVARQAMFQRLGLTNTLERGTLDFFNENIDALEEFSVCALPIEIIFPSMLRENELHSTNSRSVPPPDSNSATDSRSRRAFFGRRKR